MSGSAWLLIPLLVCAASPARAEEAKRPADKATARLTWVGPAPSAQCMRTRELEQAVDQLLSRQVFVRQDPMLEVAWVIEPLEAGGWEAQIRLRRADRKTIGTRRISTPEPDCGALDEPLALALALMVDLPVEEVQIRLPPRPPPPTPWRFGLGMGGVTSLGWQEGVPFGARSVVQFGINHVGFAELEIVSYPEATTNPVASRFHLDGWYAGLSLCPEIGNRAVRAGACLGTHLGRVYARGVDLDVNRSASVPIADVTLRGFATLRLTGPLAVSLAAGPVLPFERLQILVTEPAGERVIYESWPVQGVFELSLLSIFPP